MFSILYFFTLTILKILSLLPLRILYFLSDLFFLIIYYIIPYRKKISFHNLQNSFPNKTHLELKKIHKKFYHYFCDLFVESIKFYSISKKEIFQRYTFKNFDVFSECIAQNKNISIVSGHYGNWEWGNSLALKFNHILLPIYKPLRNKIMDRLLYKMRMRFGAKPTPKDSIIREFIKFSGQNRKIVAVFIVDQKPKLTTNALHTVFLNQKTYVSTGVEKISSKFNHAVFFMAIRKKRRGYYEVEPTKICDNANLTAEFEITKMHTQLLENLINEEPAYWLWTHRRWKPFIK